MSAEDVAAEVAALAAGVPTDERPVSDSGVEEAADPAAGAEVAHDLEIVDHAAKPVGAKVHSSTELHGADPGYGAGRPDVLHLRHEDAPGWFLLRLRRLRQHQRLQLMSTVIQRRC